MKNDERVRLQKDITTRSSVGYKVTGGKRFILDLCGHSITNSSEAIDCSVLHIGEDDNVKAR